MPNLRPPHAFELVSTLRIVAPKGRVKTNATLKSRVFERRVKRLARTMTTRRLPMRRGPRECDSAETFSPRHRPRVDLRATLGASEAVDSEPQGASPMVKPFTKVLVGTDFSECASSAVECAADVAQRYGAPLHVMHVWALPHVATSLVIDPGLEWHTPVEQAARAQLDALIERLRANHVEASSSLLSGVAWEQIVESIALFGADLVVVGAHGRTGLRRALLGSVAERVVRFSSVPVLTVPRASSR